MNEQDKLLLLEDLCARLPYGVHCIVYKMNGDIREEYDTIRYIELDNVITYKSKDDECFMLYQIKPYLRPMSSMTDEERRELNNQGYTKIAGESWHYCALNLNNAFYNPEGYKYVKINYVISLLDWLNAHHFDYRGLIEKGLALPASEGMYKE